MVLVSVRKHIGAKRSFLEGRMAARRSIHQEALLFGWLRPAIFATGASVLKCLGGQLDRQCGGWEGARARGVNLSARDSIQQDLAAHPEQPSGYRCMLWSIDVPCLFGTAASTNRISLRPKFLSTFQEGIIETSLPQPMPYQCGLHHGRVPYDISRS